MNLNESTPGSVPLPESKITPHELSWQREIAQAVLSVFMQVELNSELTSLVPPVKTENRSERSAQRAELAALRKEHSADPFKGGMSFRQWYLWTKAGLRQSAEAWIVSVARSQFPGATSLNISANYAPSGNHLVMLSSQGREAASFTFSFRVDGGRAVISTRSFGI